MRPIWMLPRECDWDQPSGPLVYRLYDGDGELLYVGTTSTFAYYRIGQHLHRTLWGGLVQFFSLEYHATEHAALTAEVKAIKAERPHFNLRSAVARGA